MDASDLTDGKDANGIIGVDNNTHNKNVYVKAGFSIYNIADTNTDIGANAINTSGTSEKVNNNRNNIGES